MPELNRAGNLFENMACRIERYQAAFVIVVESEVDAHEIGGLVEIHAQ